MTKTQPTCAEYYERYCAHMAILQPLREYASRVEAATAGRGMTAVAPLATMGTNGGPLLCDWCGKPMILEGGAYNRVPADVAWARNPNHAGWHSWISGGMVVEIQSNDTIRVYHGYPGRDPKHCCNLASAENRRLEAEFRSELTPELQKEILAFLATKHPDMTERCRVFTEMKDVLFSYNPGFGVNRG